MVCVDDDLGVLSALRRLFQSEPYELVTTASPGQALASLRRQAVAVVVSDERMPETSGTELLAEIRERWPWIGRVILTAYPDSDVKTRRVAAGIDLLLSKPWDGEALKRSIRRLVDGVEWARGHPGRSKDEEEGPVWDLGGEGG
ncbi:MAG TPA: response regulator [Planctomycetota bacterium]|nr:response regulator [Planctomycetota bacterium]